MSCSSAAESQRGSSAYAVAARRACTSRATAIAWRWSWFGWRRNCTKPAGVSTDPTHSTSPGRGGPGQSARTKRPERCATFTRDLREHEVDQPPFERLQELRDHAGGEHQQEQHQEAVGAEAVPVRQPRFWQHPLDERRAVERRDGQEVEQPEEQVHQREREEDLDAKGQLVDVGDGVDRVVRGAGAERGGDHEEEVGGGAGQAHVEHVAARVVQAGRGYWERVWSL